MEIFHITWVTYNSRVSERMKKYAIHENRRTQPFVLNDEEEIEISRYISDIVHEDNLKIIAFNICRDHVHLILVCEQKDRDNIVRKLKGKSTQLYKAKNNINKKFHLWAQKYNWSCILNDEQLSALYEYVTENRVKHNLTGNIGLKSVIEKMLTPLDILEQRVCDS